MAKCLFVFIRGNNLEAVNNRGLREELSISIIVTKLYHFIIDQLLKMDGQNLNLSRLFKLLFCYYCFVK